MTSPSCVGSTRWRVTVVAERIGEAQRQHDPLAGTRIVGAGIRVATVLQAEVHNQPT